MSVTIEDISFPSPIGLGWRIDPERRAQRALAEFGAGFIVIDENKREAGRSGGAALTDVPAQKRRNRNSRPEVPVPIPVLRFSPGQHQALLWPDGRETPLVPGNASVIPNETHARGILLQNGAVDAEGEWTVTASASPSLLEQVRAWRKALPNQPIIVADGISSPEDAVALVDAGATLLLIETGLVYFGPGLVKRCNEALLSRVTTKTSGSIHDSSPTLGATNPFRSAWTWILGLGCALTLGGVAAAILSFTRVLLPYDENYLRQSSGQLRQTMPRLFAFMAHDRGTLSGVMLGLGLFYVLVARGARQGVHGTKAIAAGSALVGFASFFAFFGFGYFDTLHAFIAAILFQLTVQILVGSIGPNQEPLLPIDRENGSWRRAQWAQLLWLIHAAGLLIAGATILSIGVSSVLVKEDLNFLCTTRASLSTLGTDLFGVVAHDRATLGGMLLSSGSAMLMLLLWCFRVGRKWVWQAVLLLGLPAYAAALGVHFWVGYIDWHHLAPAFAGLALWLAGLALSRQYLCARSDKPELR